MGVTIDPKTGQLVKTGAHGEILKRKDEKGNEVSIPADMGEAVAELQAKDKPLFNTSENVFTDEG